MDFRESIKVSVLIPVYNHGMYLEQCIQSVVHQKTDFSYEVLVGEDCSSDNSRSLLKKMEAELSNNFTILYRQANLGMVKNISDLMERARGTYQILLEGDDYWTDTHKLQYQVDFMEHHAEYSAVGHSCIVVDKNGETTMESYPECGTEKYTFEQFVQGLLPGQTATILVRSASMKEMYRRYEPYRLHKHFPEDRVRVFLMLCSGNVGFDSRKMSAYRHVSTGGHSFSANNEWNSESENQWLLFFKGLFQFACAECPEDAIICAGKLYYCYAIRRCVKRAPENRDMVRPAEIFKQLFREKHALSYILFSIKYLVMYNTTHYRNW